MAERPAGRPPREGRPADLVDRVLERARAERASAERLATSLRAGLEHGVRPILDPAARRPLIARRLAVAELYEALAEELAALLRADCEARRVWLARTAGRRDHMRAARQHGWWAVDVVLRLVTWEWEHD